MKGKGKKDEIFKRVTHGLTERSEAHKPGKGIDANWVDLVGVVGSELASTDEFLFEK